MHAIIFENYSKIHQIEMQILIKNNRKFYKPILKDKSENFGTKFLANFSGKNLRKRIEIFFENCPRAYKVLI